LLARLLLCSSGGSSSSSFLFILNDFLTSLLNLVFLVNKLFLRSVEDLRKLSGQISALSLKSIVAEDMI
jgi:hypothetical protein